MTEREQLVWNQRKLTLSTIAALGSMTSGDPAPKPPYFAAFAFDGSSVKAVIDAIVCWINPILDVSLDMESEVSSKGIKGKIISQRIIWELNFYNTLQPTIKRKSCGIKTHHKIKNWVYIK